MIPDELITAAQNYARPVVSRILRKRPDELDDVLQEAAIKVLRFGDEFRGDAQFRVYFMRIAINEALILLRKNRGRTLVDIEQRNEEGDLMWELPAFQPSPEQLVYAGEIREAVRGELLGMSPTVKRGALMIVSRSFDGKSGRAATNTEKTQVFRARRVLKEALRERGMV